MSAERDEGGFLGRWAARKRGADGVLHRDAPDASIADVDGLATDSPNSDSRDGGVAEADVPEADASGAGVRRARGARGEGTCEPASEPSAESPGRRAAEVEAARPGAGSDAGTEADDPPEPPPLSDVDMPPIESLDATSDLSGFFSKGVSASLRRAALRHVFAQPSYNVRDGLNDYDGDYTVFEPLGDTVTSDMKFHAARHERERLRREAEAEAEVGGVETSSTDESAESAPHESAGGRHESAEGRDEDVGEADDARGAEREDRRRPEEGAPSPAEDATVAAREPPIDAPSVDESAADESTGYAASVRGEIAPIETETGERPSSGTRTATTDANGDGNRGDGNRDETGHG